MHLLIILGIKGDLLPTGLALWGLVAVVSADGNRYSHLKTVAASICFSLTIAAKVTSIFGIAAATIWLLMRGKFRQAAILCLSWVACIIGVALVTQWASDGRAKAIFLMCANGGGGFARLLQGPHLLLADVAAHDRTLLAIWLLSMFVIAWTRQWTSLPAILLLVATAGTILIYGSPGTHLNHLVDMNAAAILVIATLSAKTRISHMPVLVAILLFVTLAAVGCWRQVVEIRRHNERGQMESALVDAGASTAHGPILSQDPLLPLLARREAIHVGPLHLPRAIRAREPEIASQLWDDLDEAPISRPSFFARRQVTLHSIPMRVILAPASSTDCKRGTCRRRSVARSMSFYQSLKVTRDSVALFTMMPLMCNEGTAPTRESDNSILLASRPCRSSLRQ